MNEQKKQWVLMHKEREGKRKEERKKGLSRNPTNPLPDIGEI